MQFKPLSEAYCMTACTTKYSQMLVIFEGACGFERLQIAHYELRARFEDVHN